jgi:hypothetical protein
VSSLADGSSGRLGSDVGARIDARPSRIAAVKDVGRTLLVLACAGIGIAILRFLLVFARGAIGH